MSYTWKDIKLATLQKIFAADASLLVNDESTKDYLAAMPYAANEGLQRLSTAGKFITKPIIINHMPSKNLYNNGLSIIDARDFSIDVDGGRSIYFQYTGILNLTLTGEDYPEPLEIALNSWGTFAEYRSNLTNTHKVNISFHSDYPAAVKNLAVYDSVFPTNEDIPEYGQFIKYDLKTLAEDFYNLFDNSIVYEKGGRPYYLNTTDYYRESDHILVLPADKPGMYTVYYHAYPTQISITTDDDYVMDLDPDVAVLLPLYMASQLYKDDDNGIATTYRNEFEVGLESLINTSSYSGKEKFTSEWV